MDLNPNNRWVQLATHLPLSPAERTYNIGDTITVNSTFPDLVYDRTNEQEYLLPDFLFYPLATFYRHDTIGIDTIEIVTAGNFDFIVDYSMFNLRVWDGSFGRAISGEYNYDENIYQLEFKLVTKKKGLYCMEFACGVAIIDENQEFPGKCNLVASDMKTLLNDGALNNADLLLEAVDPRLHFVYNEKLQRQFLDLGGYCFKVE